MSKRAMLIILDGWGLGQVPAADAIAKAHTPMMDYLMDEYPNSTLVTHGLEVGLPDGQMGNSEVGHLNLGAGRIVYQELARINNALEDGILEQHPVLRDGIDACLEKNTAFHFMGLLSDGGVHSHINHLLGLVNIVAKAGVQNIYIHGFTDGRDVAPTSGIEYVRQLNQQLPKQAQIVSIIGRYYAMDRDKRWKRTKLAYDLLVNGEGTPTSNMEKSILKSYQDDITDEFIKPLCMVENDNPVGRIQANDSVCFFNFRTDRPRQITEVLTQNDNPEFEMKTVPVHYMTMTRYDETFEDLHVIFEKENLASTLGEVLSKAGKTQVRIAETEKYPHVTFFFSGGREEPFVGESRILVPSPKVATYDLQPEMSAVEVTDRIIAAIEKDTPDFVCLNYANADMVGHTGVFEAAVRAAETVDSSLSRLIPVALQNGYQTFIIADHGNSDIMVNPDGTPHTAHTKNPVPCILVSKELKETHLENGKLADLAPTILKLMKVDIPKEMTGDILVNTTVETTD